jgi:hypothetical protein
MTWIRAGETEPLTPLPGSLIFPAAAHFKRNRDFPKASTALIITVNRQHDPAVEQAAPDAAEPTGKAMFGLVPAVCGIEVSHPLSPCVFIVEHFNGQLEQAGPRSTRRRSRS